MSSHRQKRSRDLDVPAAVESNGSTVAPNRIVLKRARTNMGGGSVATKTASTASSAATVPQIEFEVPPEWANLAKEPCRDKLPASLKSSFHSFIHGDRTLRRVKDKYDGTLGPLQSAMTEKRLLTAQALKKLANTQARQQARLAGGGSSSAAKVEVEPRKVGSYFQVNPSALSSVTSALTGGGKTGDELDIEVEPIMAFVRKSVLRSGAKLNYDVVSEALNNITPDDLRAKMWLLKTPSGKSRRKKVEPPAGWITTAFMKLLQERIHDLMYTTREDVEFRDGVPNKVMKQYRSLAGGDGDVPAANTDVMTTYREYLLAKREYQLRSAAKKTSQRSGRDEMDGVRDEIMQYMLKNKIRSRYLEPIIGGKKQPLFVRIKVRPPKYGKKPTVAWVRETLQSCDAFIPSKPKEGGEATADGKPSPPDPDSLGVTRMFLNGSATEVEEFRASVLKKMLEGFKERESVEVAPAEMYLSVDYAKSEDQTGGTSTFSKVQMH